MDLAGLDPKEGGGLDESGDFGKDQHTAEMLAWVKSFVLRWKGILQFLNIKKVSLSDSLLLSALTSSVLTGK